MAEHKHRASQGHLNTKYVFPSWSAAAKYCKRLRGKHRNEGKAFLPVMSPSGVVIGSRDIKPRERYDR